jgi:hypothetical protein
MFGKCEVDAFLVFLRNLRELGADGERLGGVGGEEAGADGGEGFDERGHGWKIRFGVRPRKLILRV